MSSSSEVIRKNYKVDPGYPRPAKHNAKSEISLMPVAKVLTDEELINAITLEEEWARAIPNPPPTQGGSFAPDTSSGANKPAAERTDMDESSKPKHVDSPFSTYHSLLTTGAIVVGTGLQAFLGMRVWYVVFAAYVLGLFVYPFVRKTSERN